MDETWIYIDGTDGVRVDNVTVGHAASSLCVIKNRSCGNTLSNVYIGWCITIVKDSIFFVGSERHITGVVELAARVFASVLALQSGIRRVHIRYDSEYVDNIVDVASKPNVNTVLAKLTVSIRDMVCRHVQSDSSHVYGHNCALWNEFVGVACEAASRRGLDIACIPLPSSLSEAIVQGPDSLRLLGLSSLRGKVAMQYPPGLEFGRLDFMNG